VVLRGTVQGVCVDVQVWRATPLSRAEADTYAALQLWRTLTDEVDARGRAHVRSLQTWVTAAACKGHTLCRLSGVAVTCAAVTMAALGRANVLEALRDTLAHETPRVQVDTRVVTAGRRTRPEAPLCVLVHERNLSSRLTAACTRHLLDCLCVALLSPDRALEPSLYAAWRDRHMVTCVRMRPRTECAVARTLHTAASQLDAHHLVESAHFSEEESGCLVVRVTLRADADATRYGLRDDDVVSHVAHGWAHLTRRGRTWRLMAARGRTDAVDAAARSKVTDRVAVDAEWCIPNAPHLSVEVAAYLDRRWWEEVQVVD